MLIQNLKASGILSFGPTGIDLPMRPLNVLIGVNGSGKSNLLDVLNLFHEAPTPLRSIAAPMMDDGVAEWLWKGESASEGLSPAMIECIVAGKGKSNVRHHISFSRRQNRLKLQDERIEQAAPEGRDWWFYRWRNTDRPNAAAFLDSAMEEDDASGVRHVPHDTLDDGASILSQVRDPARYEVFSHLEEVYRAMALYRDWSFGPRSMVRSASMLNEGHDRLRDGGSNLAIIVAGMGSAHRAAVLRGLKELYPGIKDFQSRPTHGNALQVYLEELGGREIPATRLSDGTLRYLSLLVILFDPNPPPLIALEEPELGLHPDILPHVAQALIEASQRTQLVVTTHSRMLVDCLGDDPESVVVCEKHNGESVFERLDGGRLHVWLEKYSLGDLWSRGELGGNRW